MPQSLSRFLMAWVAIAWLMPVQGRKQADLDSLDVWMRRMHPAPFLRCTPSDWESKLDILKSEWRTDAHGACAGSQRLASNVARQPRGRVGLGLDVGGGTRAWQHPHPLGLSRETRFGWRPPRWTACPQGPEFSRLNGMEPPNAPPWHATWATWRVAALWARPERGSTA